MKPKRVWHKGNVSTSHKKFGSDSNGMYSNNKKVLTDTPVVTETRLEFLLAYIEKYKTDKGKKSTVAHLNKEFGLNGSKKYYDGITTGR